MEKSNHDRSQQRPKPGQPEKSQPQKTEQSRQPVSGRDEKKSK